MDGQLVESYLKLLSELGASADSPLFPQCTQTSEFKINQPVGKAALRSRLTLYLHDLASQNPAVNWQPDEFSAHSLRREGASALLETGVPKEVIASHGRWQSDAILLYLRGSNKHKVNVTRML